MTTVLVTGMSGTGKSSVLAELARRGHRVVDTDDGDWIEEVSESGGTERLWRETAIEALLDDHAGGSLFVSGCAANQGTFYSRFDAVVLLSTPAEVILERVATREANRFGLTERERAAIVRDLEQIEPVLSGGATAELDTRASLDEVASALERISAEATGG